MEHARELLRLIEANRQFLGEWLPWVNSNSTLAETESFIRSAKEKFANNAGYQAGIWYQGKLVGLISLHNMNWTHSNVSMGYWLGEKYNGQGIMTAACETLISYVFTELKLHRMEIRCAEGNERSRAIAARLGFTQEGVIREAEWLYDHYVNHIVYGVLAREWKIAR